MRIVVAGGTGFLGRPLAAHLAARGHEVVVLTRRSRPASGRIRFVEWRPDTPGAAPATWHDDICVAEGVINLAGAGIADKRWTATRKTELRDSRLNATRALVQAIRDGTRRPQVFVQGSAVGYYGGVSDDRVFDESSPPGDDFLGRLGEAWEAEARPAEALGCRLLVIRTGIALAKDGGALAKMLPPFRFFVGGPIGSGRQYFSWIHRDDWIGLVTWAIENPLVSGVLDATAPNPVTNAEFSRALGRALGRPSWLPVPAFALRLLVGELAETLLTGQRVLPKRAEALGFVFRHPDVEAAIRSAL